MNKLLQVITVLILILFTGCAMRTIDLPVPSISNSSGEKGDIFIGSIEDNRVFQNNPSNVTIPSIDGTVDSLTPKVKSMRIGSQGDGYGKAGGYLQLPNNDSVFERTRRLLEEGFKRRGYSITSDSNADISARATINQFWGWSTPGVALGSFKANVSCTIILSKADSSTTIEVQGYGVEKGILARNGNWQWAYEKAFDDFLSKLDDKLSVAGY